MNNTPVSQSVEKLKVRYLVTESTLIFKKGQFVPHHVALDGRTVTTEEIVSLADAKSLLSTLVKEMEGLKQPEHDCLYEDKDDQYDWYEGCPREFRNEGISAAIEVVNRLNK